MTTEEINQAYQDFQDELTTRELHLKLLPTFKDESLDELLYLLNELKGDTPILIEDTQPYSQNTSDKNDINIL